jgi:hypothetical protein
VNVIHRSCFCLLERDGQSRLEMGDRVKPLLSAPLKSVCCHAIDDEIRTDNISVRTNDSLVRTDNNSVSIVAVDLINTPY